MEEYIKWLEKMIENTLEDKDLQREHWAFCQSLSKFRALVIENPNQCKDFLKDESTSSATNFKNCGGEKFGHSSI